MAPHLVEPTMARRGFWPQTATIDWCEPNYDVSYFVAEFWNTFSNLAFIVPQLVQYVALSGHKNVEPAFRLAFLGVALIGVGSFCFHISLARPMQMFDETSMIITSLHCFYLLYSIRQPNVNQSLLVGLLSIYALVFFTSYLFLVEWPVFQHSAFALLVYASYYVGYQLKRIHKTQYTFWPVFVLQHAALVFWFIDKHYCDKLTLIRETHLPTYLRPLLQFHAMWHLLQGLASHICVCGLIQLHVWIKCREKYTLRRRYLIWFMLDRVARSASNHESDKQTETVGKLSAIRNPSASLRLRYATTEESAGNGGEGWQDHFSQPPRARPTMAVHNGDSNNNNKNNDAN